MPFHKTVAANKPVCIHADTPFNDPDVVCGSLIYIRFHGWLCLGHFRQQQYSITRPARKPFEMFKGYFNSKTDNQLVAGIIASDAEIIRKARAAGHIVSHRFGALDPVYLQIHNVPVPA